MSSEKIKATKEIKGHEIVKTNKYIDFGSQNQLIIINSSKEIADRQRVIFHIIDPIITENIKRKNFKNKSNEEGRKHLRVFSP